MKKSQLKKYYIKNNIVYLLKESFKEFYLLRLSPPFKNKDRRVFLRKRDDLNSYKRISPQKAQENVNKKWREFEEEWEFNGKTYRVLDHELQGSTYYNTIGIRHQVENDPDSIFYLCYNQGRVCLMSYNSDQGRVCLSKFKIINDKLYVGDKIKWTSTKNCKIIYEVLSDGNLKKV